MSRALRTVVIAAAVAAAAGYAQIGDNGSSGPRQRSTDALAGSYKGVTLGDPKSAAIRAFGQPGSTSARPSRSARSGPTAGR